MTEYFELKTITLSRLVGIMWYSRIVDKYCEVPNDYDLSFPDINGDRYIRIPVDEVSSLLRETKPFKRKECYR